MNDLTLEPPLNSHKGQTIAKCLNSLQTLQNRALRCVFINEPTMSVKDMHVKANLLSLNSRRNLNIVAIAHARKFSQFKLCPARERALRSNNDLIMSKEHANNVKYEKCFVTKAIILWNSLDRSIKAIPTVRLFKTRVKSEMKLNKLNFPE